MFPTILEISEFSENIQLGKTQMSVYAFGLTKMKA